MVDIDLIEDDDDRVECCECGEFVPSMHTAIRSGVGRLCWFCYSEEEHDEDYDDDAYDDELARWESWDSWDY